MIKAITVAAGLIFFVVFSYVVTYFVWMFEYEKLAVLALGFLAPVVALVLLDTFNKMKQNTLDKGQKV